MESSAALTALKRHKQAFCPPPGADPTTAALRASLEQISEDCTNCNKCQPECSFLLKHGKPKEIADRLLHQPQPELDAAFECSLCGLCTAVCPFQVNPVEMFLSMRRHSLQQHPEQLKKYGPLLRYEDLGTSKLLTCYALPVGCQTVFFPGCALSGTRPTAVWTAFEKLRQSIPDLGLVLDCCGKPSHDLGACERFQNIIFPLQDQLRQQGIKRVLTACPGCNEIFQNYGHPLEVVSIYQLFAELPETQPVGTGQEISVHDPCPLRFHDDLHEAVRTILTKQGHQLIEAPHSGLKTLCCGEGAAVGFVAPELAGRWGRRRAAEADGKTMVSYCAGCVDFLNRNGTAVHVLDTLEMNGDLQPAARVPSLRRYWNRWQLKRQVTGELPTIPPPQRQKNRQAQGSFIKKLFILGLLIAAIAGIHSSGFAEKLDPEALRASIQQFGLLAPLIYVLFYSIAPSLFLPGLPLTIIGGVLFGPFWGVIYTISGATIGAGLAFLIARYLGRDWVASKLTGSKWQKLDEDVARNGWKVVAFTRLIPLFPFNLLNYAFGLTRIRFLDYVVTSFICMLPACIAYIVFSSSLLDVLRGRISVEFVVGLLLIVGVSLIPILYRKRQAKQSAQ